MSRWRIGLHTKSQKAGFTVGYGRDAPREWARGGYKIFAWREFRNGIDTVSVWRNWESWRCGKRCRILISYPFCIHCVTKIKPKNSIRINKTIGWYNFWQQNLFDSSITSLVVLNGAFEEVGRNWHPPPPGDRGGIFLPIYTLLWPSRKWLSIDLRASLPFLSLMSKEVK